MASVESCKNIKKDSVISFSQGIERPSVTSERLVASPEIYGRGAGRGMVKIHSGRKGCIAQLLTQKLGHVYLLEK